MFASHSCGCQCLAEPFAQLLLLLQLLNVFMYLNILLIRKSISFTPSSFPMLNMHDDILVCVSCAQSQFNFFCRFGFVQFGQLIYKSHKATLQINANAHTHNRARADRVAERERERETQSKNHFQFNRQLVYQYVEWKISKFIKSVKCVNHRHCAQSGFGYVVRFLQISYSLSFPFLSFVLVLVFVFILDIRAINLLKCFCLNASMRIRYCLLLMLIAIAIVPRFSIYLSAQNNLVLLILKWKILCVLYVFFSCFFTDCFMCNCIRKTVSK